MARKRKNNKEVEAVYEEIEEDSKEIDEEVESEAEEVEESEEEVEESEDEVEESEEIEEDSEDDDDEDEDSEDEDSEDDDDDEDDDSDEDEEDDEDLEEEEDEEPTYENPVRKSMSDTTKYVLIAILGVLIVIMCILIATKEENNSTLQGRLTNTEFLQEFYSEFDEKNTNVIFFASATCGYCTMQKPILKNISEDYNMDYYEIDASKLSEAEVNEVVNALGIEGATPTTVVTKGGKVVGVNEGYLDGKELVSFFVDNKVLDSDATYKQEERIVPITYKKFKEISDKKEASLVLVDQSACSSCITVRELLNELGEKNNFRVNYLNAAYLSQEDGQKFIQEDLDDMGYKADAYKKDKTVNIPLLLVVKDGKIKDYVLQKTEKSDYTKVLKKHGFIK